MRSKRESTKSATTRSLLVQIARAKPELLEGRQRLGGERLERGLFHRAPLVGDGDGEQLLRQMGGLAAHEVEQFGADQRCSRGGSATPRPRTNASISLATARRSSGELTSVWSRSNTQTGRPDSVTIGPKTSRHA